MSKNTEFAEPKSGSAEVSDPTDDAATKTAKETAKEEKKLPIQNSICHELHYCTCILSQERNGILRI